MLPRSRCLKTAHLDGLGFVRSLATRFPAILDGLGLGPTFWSDVSVFCNFTVGGAPKVQILPSLPTEQPTVLCRMKTGQWTEWQVLSPVLGSLSRLGQITFHLYLFSSFLSWSLKSPSSRMPGALALKEAGEKLTSLAAFGSVCLQYNPILRPPHFFRSGSSG